MIAALAGAGTLAVIFMGLFLWALLTAAAREDELVKKLRERGNDG